MLPDEAEPNSSGRPFLLRWFGSIFAEDEYTRAATRRVLMEVRAAAGAVAEAALVGGGGRAGATLFMPNLHFLPHECSLGCFTSSSR